MLKRCHLLVFQWSFEVNPFRSLAKLYDDATLRHFAQLPDRAKAGKTPVTLRALDRKEFFGFLFFVRIGKSNDLIVVV